MLILQTFVALLVAASLASAPDAGCGIDPNGCNSGFATEGGGAMDPNGADTDYSACLDPNGGCREG